MSQRGSADAVEEFLELEAELSSGTKRAETYEQGNVAGVAKIPAAEVPDGYPVSIETREALHLDVETPSGETVATYLEWPAEDEESDHVDRLLDALGRSRDEFANVYGDRVALDSVDGWHGIDPERTAALRRANRPSADDAPDLTRNLLAGAVAAGGIGFALVDTLLGNVGAFFVFLSWAAIPAAIYFDADRIETATGWSPNTTRWFAGGLVPVFNVPVGIAYLVDRHVRLSGLTPGEASGIWFKALVAAMLMLPLALTIDSIAENVAAVLFGYGWWFTPFAVYFDAKYVRDATDWDPSSGLWAVATFFTLVFGTGAYLLRRHQMTD